jgi:LmbE family N-acetylglucosaminyl deacetylase
MVMLHVPARLRRYVQPMMQAGAVMDVWRDLPLIDPSELAGAQPLLVLAPHPDDESLGCGGLIADCQARGQPVYVLILTDGAGSHRNSLEYPPARLAALRADEARAAGAALGLPEDRIAFIGQPDGHAPLRGTRLRAVARQIADYAGARGVATICTTWPGDPHHDHKAAYRAGAAAARELGAKLYCYPVWGWTLPVTAWVPKTPPRGARIDITPHLSAKQRAIACHRSQATDLIHDDPSAFRMSPEFLAYFARPFEVFVDASNDMRQ